MTKILSLCVAIVACAGPAMAQIRFENVSKAAKMEALPEG
jgi:hypothetical protein